MSYDERTELLIALREFLSSGTATPEEEDTAESLQTLLARPVPTGQEAEHG